MSLTKGILAPFSLVWNASNLMAPARNLIREGKHWSDYLLAVLYVVGLFCVLLLMAQHVTMESILIIGSVAVAVIVLKYACYYYLS